VMTACCFEIPAFARTTHPTPSRPPHARSRAGRRREDWRFARRAR
jgi:hypothetical protein